MQYVNLVLALIWFAATAYLYFYEPGQGRNANRPFPLYAVTLILGVYNLVRWWSFRMRDQNRAEGEQMLARRPPLRRPGDDVKEPDPNVIFNDPPKPPGAPPTPGTNGEGHPPKPEL
jgi:hypothetical protein